MKERKRVFNFQVTYSVLIMLKYRIRKLNGLLFYYSRMLYNVQIRKMVKNLYKLKNRKSF